MLRRFFGLALVVPVVGACSGGSSTVAQSGSEDRDDGGGGSGGDAPLSSDASASPNLPLCRTTCALPRSGPCKDADGVACIEKCTATLDRVSAKCAQCVTENSSWAGVRCLGTCTACTCSEQFGGPQHKTPCSEGQTPPPCSSSDERCDGFTFARTTVECASFCM
jgi:hypothetical protein